MPVWRLCGSERRYNAAMHAYDTVMNMVFSEDDSILTKKMYEFKGYGAKKTDLSFQVKAVKCKVSIIY